MNERQLNGAQARKQIDVIYEPVSDGRDPFALRATPDLIIAVAVEAVGAHIQKRTKDEAVGHYIFALLGNTDMDRSQFGYRTAQGAANVVTRSQNFLRKNSRQRRSFEKIEGTFLVNLANERGKQRAGRSRRIAGRDREVIGQTLQAGLRSKSG